MAAVCAAAEQALADQDWDVAKSGFDELINASAAGDGSAAADLPKWHNLRGFASYRLVEFQPAIADYTMCGTATAVPVVRVAPRAPPQAMPNLRAVHNGQGHQASRGGGEWGWRGR